MTPQIAIIICSVAGAILFFTAGYMTAKGSTLFEKKASSAKQDCFFENVPDQNSRSDNELRLEKRLIEAQVQYDRLAAQERKTNSIVAELSMKMNSLAEEKAKFGTEKNRFEERIDKNSTGTKPYA